MSCRAPAGLGPLPWLALALLLFSWAMPASASSRLAVLDFDSPGARALEADPWSFGLADFLSAELAERGADVYERRALRAVLAERALLRSGFVADPEAVARALPQLGFLLSGAIEPRGADRFSLQVSALDTRSGRVAALETAQGRYPDDLATALDDLARRLLSKLGARRADASQAAPPGFTRNPDVAVQFYKGLDHLVHGRPEFAAEYFRQAHLADRGFQVAAAWRMRAYEALGLVDLARYVRGTLLASREGRRVFQLVAPSLAHDRGSLVVAVPRGEARAPELRDLETQVAAAIEASPGLELFSARWIRALADELDLRLSGEISPYAVESQAWLAADLVLRVERGANGGARVDAIDTVSGARLARIALEPGQPVAHAVRSLRERLESGTPGEWRVAAFGPRPLQPLDYALPDGDIARYTRQGYAYLLRDFAEHPRDPRKIASHVEMHRLHSHAEHEPGIYDHEWGYEELLWRRLLAAVDPEDPEAPNWLSLALWKLRLHGNDNGDGDSPNWWYNRGKRVPTVAEHFAPLLERHPDSLAALCVLYSLALEHAMWGRHEKAARLLVELAERPHAENGLELDYASTANLFALASIEAKRTGRPRRADTYAARALQHAQRFTHYRTPSNFERERKINGHDHPVEPVIPGILYTPPGRAGHAEGHWYVGAMAKTVFIDRRVRFLREEPMNGEIAKLAGVASPGDDLPSLGVQYRAAIAQTGAAGIEARLAYLRRLAREIREGTPVSMSDWYGRPEDTLFPWLDERVRGADRSAFEAVVTEVVEAGVERRYLESRLAMRLYAAASMDDSVLVLAEKASRLGSTTRVHGVVAKGGVVMRRAGALVAAKYLAHELTRFERDFEGVRGMRYLDIVHACGQAFEAAGELHRASDVYARALEAPLFQSRTGSDRARLAGHHRASLRYRQADLEARRGNASQAADLLKQVIESSEAHPDWLIHYTGHQARTAGTLTLYRAALRDLDRLRAAPPPAAGPVL